MSNSELIAGLSTAGFLCLGYLEAFSMLCRGFSLHIMTDIYKNEPLTLSGIISNYGKGRGAGWLLTKRIESLTALKMVSNNENAIELIKPRGLFVGKMGLLIKKNLQMGQGG